MVTQVNQHIIETNEKTQEQVDSIYESFCGTVKEEMATEVENKIITIKLGLSYKREKIKKARWTDHLSQLWNNLCEVECKWQHSYAARKTILKAEMRATQRVFDKEVQGVKRIYWRNNQEGLMRLNSTDHMEFWKKIGKIGVAAERTSNIPMEVIIDGVVEMDRETAVKKWQDDVSAL